ncbi:MAG: hypothetical protein OQK69_12910 [Gammaproteobacteria bacterium]|nr:hypothetical protein [Gammaproteobacteria bacterium]
MTNTITDRRILKEIYERYYNDFVAYDKDESLRSTKIYVPIDCNVIASKFNVDPDIIFGRLYYHLDKKHGYTKDNGHKVHLFAMKAGEDMHTVNFPMLAAVLAEHEQSYYRFLIPLVLSVVALSFSIAGLLAGGT